MLNIKSESGDDPDGKLTFFQCFFVVLLLPLNRHLYFGHVRLPRKYLKTKPLENVIKLLHPHLKLQICLQLVKSVKFMYVFPIVHPTQVIFNIFILESPIIFLHVL